MGEGPAGGREAREDRSEKIRQFRELLRDEPDDPLLLFSLGQSLLEAGSPAEAIDAFERALAVSPEYSAVYRGLGRAYEGAGRREDALRIYETGREIACRRGDLQTEKEIEVFIARLRTADGG